MRRREFVAGLALASSGAFPTRAQQGRRTYFILWVSTEAQPDPFIAGFRDGMRERGYIEGHGSPAVLPARNATQTIPVVFVAAIDPIAVGLVSNLARPSGNVTGFTALFADLMGKRLELLQEILPSLSDVVLLSREANPGHAQYVREIETAARTLNVKVRVLLVTNPSDFEQVFRQVEGADALIQIDDAMFTAHRHELVALAAKHRIPGVYGPREFVDLGGFAAFGPSYSDLYLRAAAYVDRIFKGTKPGDLPVQQPAKFELVLNPKTANSLGLTIPPTLLARADEVIE